MKGVLVEVRSHIREIQDPPCALVSGPHEDEKLKLSYLNTKLNFFMFGRRKAQCLEGNPDLNERGQVLSDL